MGDEMSKRQKFLFLTWVGPSVGVIKRAKMSIDKAMVKDIIVVSLSYMEKHGVEIKMLMFALCISQRYSICFLTLCSSLQIFPVSIRLRQ
jgi:hypothetical protein